MTDYGDGPIGDADGMFSGDGSDPSPPNGAANGATILRGVRVMFGSLAGGVVLFTIVIVVTASGSSTDDTSSIPPVVFGVVLAGLLVAQLVHARVEKPLNCADPKALAMSYQTRMIVRTAIGEVAGLVGVVAFFLTGAWWTLIAGLAIAAIGFVRAAPTTAAIVKEQERLQLAGCPHALLDALRRPMDPQRR